MTIRFDRCLLAPADLEFVVVADTHYMLDVGDAPLEFESRRKQGRRAGAAWEAIGALDPDFVVHLGDIVQEFPGRPDFERAMAQSLAQIDAAGVRERCRFVVGNHDIGDRPDPTMPTGSVTEPLLRTWEDRFGPSWQTWDAAGYRFIALNSQLLNTDLPAAARQRAWFEQTLAAGDTPCILFLHMPPYLRDPHEPWLGHYDNLGEPDRTWLLDLVRRHRVLAWFCGHVHFQFFDHLDRSRGPCRGFVTPSSSFTRPGFSHLFHSSPPPEQGRDDVPKMGFFLCRIVAGRLDVHRVRMAQIAAAGDDPVLLTPVAPTSQFAKAGTAAADDATAAGDANDATGETPVSPASGADAFAGFGLGITLRHPLATHTEVPVAWPSVIRQPVRNDYPLLACLELDARWTRVPVADLLDPLQARRLRILRAEGVALQAVILGEEDVPDILEALRRADGAADAREDGPAGAPAAATGRTGGDGDAQETAFPGGRPRTGGRAGIDCLEVHLPGRALPDLEALGQLGRLGLPLVLCPVLPGQPVAGKQHKRTRIGYRPDELEALDTALREAELAAAAACRLEAESAAETVAALRRWAAAGAEPGPGLSGLVLLGELPGQDDDVNVLAVARWALVAAALDTPLFLEPLIDLDRTMDVAHGLLDALCNPRPAFDAARCAAAMVGAGRWQGEDLVEEPRAGRQVLRLGRRAWLVAPGSQPVRLGDALGEAGASATAGLRVCHVASGRMLAGDADLRLAATDAVLAIAPCD